MSGFLIGCGSTGNLEKVSDLDAIALRGALFETTELRTVDTGELTVALGNSSYRGSYSFQIEQNKYHCSAGIINFLQHYNSANGLNDAHEKGNVTLTNIEGHLIECSFKSTCSSPKYVGYCEDKESNTYKLTF